MSPALMEAYLSAAGKISRLAIGTATAATQAVYVAPEDVSQNYHVEGLPFGTRGGMLIKHEFPADADYVFKIFPINKGNMGGSGAVRRSHRASSSKSPSTASRCTSSTGTAR